MTQWDPGSGDKGNSQTVSDPFVLAVYRYWRLKCAGRPMPARQDLDPVDIPALLPYMFMVDVLEAPRRYRYRLMGTAIAKFLGRDFTGCIIDTTTYGPGVKEQTDLLDETIARRGPVWFLGTIACAPGLEWQRVEGVLVPLSRDGDRIDILLAGYNSPRQQAPGLVQQSRNAAGPILDRFGFRIVAAPRNAEG